MIPSALADDFQQALPRPFYSYANLFAVHRYASDLYSIESMELS
jgi:hypothetical protein